MVGKQPTWILTLGICDHMKPYFNHPQKTIKISLNLVGIMAPYRFPMGTKSGLCGSALVAGSSTGYYGVVNIMDHEVVPCSFKICDWP